MCVHGVGGRLREDGECGCVEDKAACTARKLHLQLHTRFDKSAACYRLSLQATHVGGIRSTRQRMVKRRFARGGVKHGDACLLGGGGSGCCRA